MDKFVLNFLISIFIALQTNAQDFLTYKIENVGTIKIPTTMEYQTGDYKGVAAKYIESFGYSVSGDRVVFQQKGLNELENESFQKYCRVIIETKYGDFEQLSSIKEKVSVTDIEQANKVFKKQLIKELSLTKMELLSYYGVGLPIINKQACVKISYLRSGKDYNKENPVKVSRYMFQNKDRMHILTISYRMREESFWLPQIIGILNSFEIIKL